MAHRFLPFLLFFIACAGEEALLTEPKPLLDNAYAIIIQEPIPLGFDATECYEITPITGKYLTGSASAIVGNVAARSQVQWIASEEQGFDRVNLKLVPKPGVMFKDSSLFASLLQALNAKLEPTKETNQYLLLRANNIKEELILGTSLHAGSLSPAVTNDSLLAHGIHLRNDTGFPLTTDPETLEFYLPSLHQFFGDSIAEVDFWLETKELKGMRLVHR